MKVKFCLPIIKKSKGEVLEMIKKNQDYDFFEVWLDYVEDVDESFVNELVKNNEGKMVFLFRRQNLEPVKMKFEDRKKIISMFQRSKCYVDLDITSQKDELDFIRDAGLDVLKIVSYHNYKETPKTEVIDAVVDEILEYHPIVVKVSTFCNRDIDALRLMVLLLDLKIDKQRFIVLGMGDYGKITRIFGMMKGNAMNYAPKVLSEKSASGQLTREELGSICDILS